MLWAGLTCNDCTAQGNTTPMAIPSEDPEARRHDGQHPPAGIDVVDEHDEGSQSDDRQQVEGGKADVYGGVPGALEQARSGRCRGRSGRRRSIRRPAAVPERQRHREMRRRPRVDRGRHSRRNEAPRSGSTPPRTRSPARSGPPGSSPTRNDRNGSLKTKYPTSLWNKASVAVTPFVLKLEVPPWTKRSHFCHCAARPVADDEGNGGRHERPQGETMPPHDQPGTGARTPAREPGTTPSAPPCRRRAGSPSRRRRTRP